MTLEIANENSLKWLEKQAENSIDAVIADVPYSSGGKQREVRAPTWRKYCQTDKRPAFAGEQMDQRSYRRFTEAWLQVALPAVKDGGYVMIFTDWRQYPTVSDALQMAGFTWRGVVTWDKTEGVRPNKAAFRQQSEFVLWGTKGAKPKEGPILPGVYRAANVTRNKLHQTQKPVKLMKDLMGIVPAGSTICDPFMGSGTTGVAALELGHRFLGCELVPEIFAIAQDRLRTGSGTGQNEVAA